MLKKFCIMVSAIMTVMSVNVSEARNPYNEMDVIDAPRNMTLEECAVEQGITVEEFKEKYGLPEDMPADTNIKAASGFVSIKAAAEGVGVPVEDLVEAYRSDYPDRTDITENTLLKDVMSYDFEADRAELAIYGNLSYFDGDEILVMVKGKYIDFDVAPVIENDRVLVPMRNIFTALGAEVYWQSDVQTVLAVKGNDIIAMQLGQNVIYKNNEKIEIPTASIARDGRVLVPIRAVAEALDTEVFYNEKTQTVVIH